MIFTHEHKFLVSPPLWRLRSL